MNNNNDSLLSKIDFESKTCLLNMLDNVITSSPDKLIHAMSIFNSSFLSNKLFCKINQYEHNGSPNTQVISSIKIIKIFCMINIYKQKYFFVEENINNFNTDLNLVNHYCYKMITSNDQESTTKNEATELDILTNIFMSKYIDDLSFDKLKSLLDSAEVPSEKDKKANANSQMNCLNKFSYENFQKYFKIMIKFYIFIDNYEYLFNLLEKKDKVMTAELTICLNKLNRGLTEANYGYMITKRFIELIDTTQIFLSKEEYYTMFLRSLNS